MLTKKLRSSLVTFSYQLSAQRGRATLYERPTAFGWRDTCGRCEASALVQALCPGSVVRRLVRRSPSGAVRPSDWALRAALTRYQLLRKIENPIS